MIKDHILRAITNQKWKILKKHSRAGPIANFPSGSSMIITIIMNIIGILKIFGAWSFSNILTNLCRSRESTFHRGPAGQKAEEQSDVSDKPFSVKWNIPREREPEKYFKLSPFFLSQSWNYCHSIGFDFYEICQIVNIWKALIHSALSFVTLITLGNLDRWDRV